MGQASSRPGSREPQVRSRPTPQLQSSRDAHDGGDYGHRPLSQRFNPLARRHLSRIPSDDPTATSPAPTPSTTSAPAASPDLSRTSSRLHRARSSLSALPTLLHRRRSPPEASPPPSTTQTTVPPSSSGSGSSSSARARIRARARNRNAAPIPPEIPPPPYPVRLPTLDLDITTTPIGIPPPGVQYGTRRTNGRSVSMLPSFRPERGIRSMTSQLRRRRSPLRREDDQAAMLSSLLSAAAVATAASLMGDDPRAVADARAIGEGVDDGTFDGFLQSLQNGRIAAALRQSSGAPAEQGGDPLATGTAPLNFFRMFRFGSSNSSRGAGAGTGNQGGGAEGGDSQDGGGDGGDGRMVPIIIVGIRSITPGNAAQDDHIPPFLDALSSFPTAAPASEDTNPEPVLRPQPQQRFSHRRRASMGGSNTLPVHRAPERVRPWSTFSDSSGVPAPPSTPASGGLSAISSGSTTPVASTSPPESSAPSRRGSFVRRALEPTAEEPSVRPRIPRQRRMSDSEFTTRFGSGSARRNGVVEPDHNPGEGTRSWIIYVLGGSYPENHPILTTPSLFTDSPTYEDMMLLSTLLGPAKPPVASEEDVASAPGLFRIAELDGSLVAQAIAGSEVISLMSDTRCLVCLCDFEATEEARKLVNCGHLFHRECIDQWLTTGRNSCPLCRAQGVGANSTTPPGSPRLAQPVS